MYRFHRTHYSNEHTEKSRQKDQIHPQKVSGKIKFYIKISVIVTTFLGTFGLLFLHPFFTMRVIDIKNLQRLPENEIRDTVSGILSYKKYYIFPQNNYFLIDLSDLHEIVTGKYPMKKLTIRKVFPHTLSLEVEEKPSKIIYDNGEQYSFLDEDGRISEIVRVVDPSEWKVISKSVTSTNEKGEEISSEEILSRFHSPDYKSVRLEIGEYPLVYDQRGKKVSKNEQVLEIKTLEGIMDWYQKIKNQTDVPLSYFEFGQELGDIIIKTSEGWIIKAKLNESIEMQFQTLQYILREKVKRPNLQYIDVRFSGKAFWL